MIVIVNSRAIFYITLQRDLDAFISTSPPNGISTHPPSTADPCSIIEAITDAPEDAPDTLSLEEESFKPDKSKFLWGRF